MPPKEALLRTFSSDPLRRNVAVAIVVGTVLDGINQGPELIAGHSLVNIIQALVERIDVRRDCVGLKLLPVDDKPTELLTAAATLIRSGRQTRLVPPGVQTTNAQVPDEGLIRLVANAHAARLALPEGHDQPVDAIAEEHGFTAHYFAQLIRLGGLAPDIVTAILEGRQPAHLTRTRLARTKALPFDWNEQRRLFGFA